LKKSSTENVIVLIVLTFLVVFFVSLVVSVSALPLGSIVINHGDSYTTSTNVTLTLSYNDAVSEVKQVRYSNNDSAWDAWEAPRPTKEWTLTSGDGTKTVYYQIRNRENEPSPTYSDTIILDTTSISLATSGLPNGVLITYTFNGLNHPATTPQTYSEQVNSGAVVSFGISPVSYTQTNTIYTLDHWQNSAGQNITSSQTITKTDTYVAVYTSIQKVAKPIFSPAGATYSTAQSVTISSATAGAKICYTTNGSEPTSSSTVYDNIPISVSNGTVTIKAKAFKIEMLDSDTASETYIIERLPNVGQISGRVTTSDGNGISEVIILIKGDSFSNATFTDTTGHYAFYDLPLKNCSVTASKNGYAEQNKSAAITEEGTIVNFQLIDTEPPSIPNPNDGISGWTNDNTPTFTWTASDAGVGIAGYYWKVDSGPENWTTSNSVTLSAQSDGSHTFSVRAKDKDGNLGGYGSHVFQIDTVRPSGSILINQGSQNTSSSSVTLTLNYTDVTSGVDKVRYSNDGVWDSEEWETPSLTKNWILTSSDGIKTVYYQIKDNAGLESTTYTDTIILDLTPPSVPNPDDGVSGWSNDNTPTFTWSPSSDEASGVAGYYWRVDNSSETWTTLTSVTIPPQSDGSHTFFIKAKDRVGNTGAPGSHAFKIDTTPPLGTILIEQGDQYTPSTSVTLTISYSDATSGVDKTRFSNDGVWDTEQWEAPSTTKSWTLSAGDETKKVYFQIRDNAGLISSTSDDIILVTSVPTGSIIINEGASYTMMLSVRLKLTYGNDASQVRYSNDGVWDNEQWEAPSLSKTWSLTTADGKKTVYYQLKNNAETVSPTYSTSIILDTVSPTGSISIAGGVAYTNNKTVSLTLTASDATSGLSQMRLSTDGVFDTEQWENYTNSKFLSLTGGDETKTVYVQFKDKAGLESSSLSDTILLDTTPPTGSIRINNDSPETNSNSVLLALTANDTNGVVKTRFSNDGISWSSWENFSATNAWTMASGNGIQTVYVQFQDSTGLDSQVHSDSINLVTDQPSSSSSTSTPSTPSSSSNTTNSSDSNSIFRNLVVFVKDPNNNPINGANVVSVAQPQDQASLSGITNSTGHVTFINVLPGSYSIRVYKGNIQSDTIESTVSNEHSVTVTATLDLEDNTESPAPNGVRPLGSNMAEGLPTEITLLLKITLMVSIAAMGALFIFLSFKKKPEI
jgi:hypothetical protein